MTKRSPVSFREPVAGRGKASAATRDTAGGRHGARRLAIPHATARSLSSWHATASMIEAVAVLAMLVGSVAVFASLFTQAIVTSRTGVEVTRATLVAQHVAEFFASDPAGCEALYGTGRDVSVDDEGLVGSTAAPGTDVDDDADVDGDTTINGDAGGADGAKTKVKAAISGADSSTDAGGGNAGGAVAPDTDPSGAYDVFRVQVDATCEERRSGTLWHGTIRVTHGTDDELVLTTARYVPESVDLAATRPEEVV